MNILQNYIGTVMGLYWVYIGTVFMCCVVLCGIPCVVLKKYNHPEGWLYLLSGHYGSVLGWQSEFGLKLC